VKVAVNISMSLDGKIGWPDGRRKRLASAEDLRRMRGLREKCDAVLVGGETFRTWAIPYAAEHPIVNAVLTRKGILEALPDTLDRWRGKGVSLQAFTHSESQEIGALRALGVEVTTSPEPSPCWALERLEAQGCQRLLIEGGGGLLHPLFSAGRIDDLHLTLCPVVLGGNGPGVASGRALEIPPHFRHMSVQSLGNEVFLHYRRIQL
jgi:5-amino-6-(5-phosphoribosylamino)uracil reductase